MTAKPVVPRELANRDIEEAIAWYLGEGAEQSALGFVAALEQAYANIGRHPISGSPRYAHELNLPGLRFWPLTRYPHLVFYVERPEHIDVWRVLGSIGGICDLLFANQTRRDNATNSYTCLG